MFAGRRVARVTSESVVTARQSVIRQSGAVSQARPWSITTTFTRSQVAAAAAEAALGAKHVHGGIFTRRPRTSHAPPQNKNNPLSQTENNCVCNVVGETSVGLVVLYLQPQWNERPVEVINDAR